MPRDFECDGIIFSFGDEWTVVQYDETIEHQRNPNQDVIPHAVDFLAVKSRNTICFIEAKDFRINPGNDRKKIISGTLALDVAHKIRDTIAGVIGFHRTASPTNNRNQIYAPFAEAMAKPNVQLRVILWMETDFNFLPHFKQKQRASTFSKILKAKLSWITTEVLICNQDITPTDIMGISARNA